MHTVLSHTAAPTIDVVPVPPFDDQSWLRWIHDVRQPLTAMLTNAEAALGWLATDPPEIGKARRALGRIVGNGGRAADTIGSAGRSVPHPSSAWTSVDLNDMVPRLVEFMSLDIHRQGIAVETQLECGMARVMGDRVDIERALTNLIANGIDAMRSVPIRKHRLRVCTRVSDDGYALVVVEDSGTGIDSAQVNRIFQSGVTTKPMGLGLGLAISRSVAEAHGGRLWVEPNQPYGCAFFLALPRISTPDREAQVRRNRCSQADGARIGA